MLFDEVKSNQIELAVFTDPELPIPRHDAIHYKFTDDEFIKIVDSDKCDRPCFESLRNNIMFLRKISFYPELTDVLQLPKSTIIKDGFILEITYERSSIGSLKDFMDHSVNQYRINENLLCKIAARIASNLEIIHRNHLIFRAINPYHVLLFPQHDGTVSVKFCGTGSICKYYPFRNDLPLHEVCWRGWHYNDCEQNPIVWYSPECLIQDYTGYDPTTDVYSFALMLASLYTGVAPYSDRADPPHVYLKKLTEDPDTIFDRCDFIPSLQFLDFFHNCTKRSPCDRMSSRDILDHPWIKRGLETPLTFEDLEIC